MSGDSPGMKLFSLTAFALLLWTHAASAQTDDTASGALELSSPVAPEDAPGLTSMAMQRPTDEDVLALRLELSEVNHQHDVAMALHITSTVLAVVGTGLVAGGIVSLFSNWGASDGVAPALLLTGASLNIAHVLFTIVGACLDYGSASHRRKLLAAHPELAFSLTPGPGDVGLGLAVHF